MGNAISNKITEASVVEAQNLATYYRMTASKHKQQRGTLLQEAAEHMVMGDTQQAEKLQALAAQEQRLMMEAQLRAADSFVRANRPMIKKPPPRTIDLHGLYDEQAKEIVRREIKDAMSHGETEVVFMVGTAETDSAEGAVRIIYPVLEKLSGKYGFSCAADKPVRGCVEVDLTARPGQELSNYEMYAVLGFAVIVLFFVASVTSYFVH